MASLLLVMLNWVAVVTGRPNAIAVCNGIFDVFTTK
jgi:hypothetical protein